MNCTLLRVSWQQLAAAGRPTRDLGQSGAGRPLPFVFLHRVASQRHSVTYADITVSSCIRRVRLEMMFSAAGKDFIKKDVLAYIRVVLSGTPQCILAKKIQTDSKLMKDMQHQSA